MRISSYSLRYIISLIPYAEALLNNDLVLVFVFPCTD